MIRTAPIPSTGTVVVEEVDLVNGSLVDLIQGLVLDGIPVLVTLGDAGRAAERVRWAGGPQAVTVVVAAPRRRIQITGVGAPEPLTAREHEVMRLAVRGSTARAIADRLGIGVRTVETHLDHVYRKTGVHSREALIERLDTVRTNVPRR